MEENKFPKDFLMDHNSVSGVLYVTIDKELICLKKFKEHIKIQIVFDKSGFASEDSGHCDNVVKQETIPMRDPPGVEEDLCLDDNGANRDYDIESDVCNDGQESMSSDIAQLDEINIAGNERISRKRKVKIFSEISSSKSKKKSKQKLSNSHSQDRLNVKLPAKTKRNSDAKLSKKSLKRKQNSSHSKSDDINLSQNEERSGENKKKKSKLGSEELFSCPYCAEDFENKIDLETHHEIKTMNHPCEKCNRIFKYQAFLIVHYDIVHNIETPLTTLKDVCTSDHIKKILDAHRKSSGIMASENDLKTYRCKICDLRFTAVNTLNRHMMKHTGESIYKCCVCEFKHYQSYNLKRHLTYHDKRTQAKDNRIFCPHCSRFFKTEEEVKAHHEVETNNYACDTCHKMFKYEAHLIVHTKIVHNIETPFPASDDPELSVWKSAGQHESCSVETSDAGVNLYRCHICVQGLASVRTLSKHMMRHTGENIYKCCVCEFRNCNMDNLNRHFALHDRCSKEKEISCPHCSKIFKGEHEFKVHHEVDTIDYACEKCLKNFKYNAHLIVHKKLVHNIESPTSSKCDSECAEKKSDAGNNSGTCSEVTSDTGTKFYKCEICNFELASVRSLNTHMMKHFGENIYKCCVCEFQCCNFEMLNRHLASRDTDNGTCPKFDRKSVKSQNSAKSKTKPLLSGAEGAICCPYCSVYFQNKQEFLAHRATKPDNLTCQICKKVLKFKANLIVHYNIVHNLDVSDPSCDNIDTSASIGQLINESCFIETNDTGLQTYWCKKCSLSFASERTLNVHMMKHTGEHLYKCCVCDFGCGTYDILSRHMALHDTSSNSKAEDICCPNCLKIFQSDRDYRKHHEIEQINRYPCDKCFKVFKYKAHLIIHNDLDHILGTSVSSNVDSNSNLSVRNLDDNKLYHTSCCVEIGDAGLKTYKCMICNIGLTCVRNIKNHMMQHTNENIYSCCICEFQTTISSTFQRHLNTHTRSMRFECKLCKIYFTNRGELSRHQLTHKFHCKLCGQDFANRTTRYFHYRTFHKDNILKCHLCDRLYSCKKMLESHINYHRRKHQIQCPVCGIFVTRLRQHMTRSHSNDPKGNVIECDKCQKQFTNQSSYHRHLYSHLEEKMYSCSHCPKQFANSGRLNRHMRIHMDEKPYICEICGKSCKQSYNLKVHMRTHEKSEALKCKLCGVEFSRKSDLEEHTHVMHNEDVTKAHQQSYFHQTNTNTNNIQYQTFFPDYLSTE